MKRVFQPQYSCGAPLSRELTREKHERLFMVDACGVQQLRLPSFPQGRFLVTYLLEVPTGETAPEIRCPWSAASSDDTQLFAQ